MNVDTINVLLLWNMTLNLKYNLIFICSIFYINVILGWLRLTNISHNVTKFNQSNYSFYSLFRYQTIDKYQPSLAKPTPMPNQLFSITILCILSTSVLRRLPYSLNKTVTVAFDPQRPAVQSAPFHSPLPCPSRSLRTPLHSPLSTLKATQPPPSRPPLRRPLQHSMPLTRVTAATSVAHRHETCSHHL